MKSTFFFFCKTVYGKKIKWFIALAHICAHRFIWNKIIVFTLKLFKMVCNLQMQSIFIFLYLFFSSYLLALHFLLFIKEHGLTKSFCIWSHVDEMRREQAISNMLSYVVQPVVLGELKIVNYFIWYVRIQIINEHEHNGW